MAGIKPLRRLQLGREAVAGTAIPATTIWRGPGLIADNQERIWVDEDVGYVSGINRHYCSKLIAGLSMDPIEATFEQFPHILEAGIKTVTPTQDGTGTDYIYTYTAPTTALNTIKTYTLEGGDNQEAEEMEYAFVSDFKLEGEAGQALKMSANWIGRQATVTTFTPALALPVVEEILFGKGKLYIDTLAGTIGTTLKSNTFLKMALNVKTGWIPVFGDGGQLYFMFAKFGPKMEVTLDITFEHDAISAAEKVKWRAGTGSQIRLLWEGSTFGTPGTTYTKKTLRIDLAGAWQKFNTLEENDGNDVLTGTFKAAYDGTAAKFFEVLLAIELAALP